MRESSLSERRIAAARGMNERGINVNKSGNVSVRVERGGRDGFLVTPTGVPYASLTPGDLVWMPLTAASVEDREGALLPSSEWSLHRAVYAARPDAGAVVHTHSAYATALACQNEGIPAFHYMVAVAGGSSIDVVPYATFGTELLGQRTAEALRVKNACLLEHHGVVALGPTPEKALDLAAEVENLARQYVIVRGLGTPHLLSDEEMAVVIEKFRTYGKQPARDGEGTR